jgi:cytochrome oxidase assembly protein ShyY1
VYRFLLSPRWLGGAALAVAAAVVMALLGNWQLSRYHERSAINARIDAGASGTPAPLASVLTPPTVAGASGPSPAADTAWTKVTATGRYDSAHEILARGRTVAGAVGFEIVTPLLLDDGTAVLVDRGWVPPADGGAIATPVVPAAPTGTVTVVGQVHFSESRPSPIDRREGRIDTRRIALPQLARELPYPVYGAYVLLTEQTPAADPLFVKIPIDHENAWQNGGYAVQWWMFAVMALVAFGWQARREARGDGPRAAPADRIAESDRRIAAAGTTPAAAASPPAAAPSAAAIPPTAAPSAAAAPPSTGA